MKNFFLCLAIIFIACPVPLFAQAALKLRSIGPSGGLIFYDKGNVSNGWRYLEAAPSDSPTEATVQWCNGKDASRVWEPCYTQTGATGTAIGTGQTNTANIIKAQEVGTLKKLGIYAAKVCFDDGWFLPSKDELNKMYVNLQKGVDEKGVVYTSVGNFAPYRYWSSSEYNSFSAWNQNFCTNKNDDACGRQSTDDGSRSNQGKGNAFFVRCVRAFK